MVLLYPIKPVSNVFFQIAIGQDMIAQLYLNSTVIRKQYVERGKSTEMAPPMKKAMGKILILM